MRVKVEHLKQSLEIVKPGIASRDIVEQMTHYIFTKDAVTAYDDQICVSYPIQTDLRCTVNANTLLKFVKRLKIENLKVSIGGDDKSLLICKGQGIESEIPVLLSEDIYLHVAEVQKQMKKTKWIDVPENMMDAMAFCMFAASKNATEANRICVGIKGSDVMAGDGHRFSWARLEESTRKNFMISAKSVSEIIRFGGFSQFCVSDSWVHFKTKDKATFHIRLNKGTYPIAKCKPLFEGFEGKEITLKESDREAIKEAVETAGVISEDLPIDRTVKIRFEDNKVTCEGDFKTGKVTRRRKISYSGKEFEFLINPTFILQILDKEELATIVAGDKKVNFIVGDFQHIIALKRSK